MQYPDFYESIEKITLSEPLGEMLGSFSGVLKFRYLDCVKLAGHSCPTVAGAFLFCLLGLKALYKDDIGVRGEVMVLFKADKEDGATGVMANVVSYIMGAKQDDGFKGFGNKFCRNNLLQFGCDINCDVRFIRLDNKHFVDMNYNLAKLPLTPINMTQIQKIINSELPPKVAQDFADTWQKRVLEILITYQNDAISIKEGTML